MLKRYPVRAARPKLKSYLLATVAALAAGASPRLVHAQQAQQPASTQDAAPRASDSVNEVVVTGYRKSLAVARDIKKDAVIQVDVIVAEDMAKFPELNLAESLQ